MSVLTARSNLSVIYMRLIKVENMLPRRDLGGESKFDELLFSSSQAKRGGNHGLWKSILCG